MFKMMLCAGFIFLSAFQVQGSVRPQDLTIKLYTAASIKKFLGPYPAKGSEAEAQDFATLYHYQETRTQEECAAAAKTENANLSNLFVGEGMLTSSEARVLSFNLAKAL